MGTKEWLSLAMNLAVGLGVFLYGMFLMSEGLQKVAGARLKKTLEFLTKNKFMGIALGAAITGIIQSSSATTVMTVGLVNAGLMKLTQAISVVMGANIGTTVTGQIIAFKIVDYYPFLVILGVIFALFATNRKLKLYGSAVLGLGFLFFGICLMSDGVAPLKQSPVVSEFFQKFSDHMLWALFAGTLMTCILQSSSATIGLTMVLASQGLIDYDAAIPMVIGDNIGTTITAQLACIGTSLSARRTAMSHTLFNVFGACLFLPFIKMGYFQQVVALVTPGDPANLNQISRFIANCHSGFNIATTLIFMNFIPVLEKASIFLVPGKEAPEEDRPTSLEKHLLDTPTIAIGLVKKEILYMMDVAKEATNLGIQGIIENNDQYISKVRILETTTDLYQKDITEYLISISERELGDQESEQLPTLMHSVNDLERIGDYAENLTEVLDKLKEHNIILSDVAKDGLIKMNGLVNSMYDLLKNAIDKENSQDALKIIKIEDEVDELRKVLSDGHIERLKHQECDYYTGILYLDCLNNLEKVSDHLKNIGQAAYNMFKYGEGKVDSDDEK